MATGCTGMLLAKEAKKQGAAVTLVLGPVSDCILGDSFKKLIRFKFFNELKDILRRELASKKYDIVIHCAAVADYQPRRIYKRKISSGRKRFTLALIPAPKLVDRIKKIDRSLFAAAFKFETEPEKGVLINKAKLLLKRANLDMVVANTISQGRYTAYIIDKKGRISGPILSKEGLAKKLLGQIGEIYAGT